MKKLIFLLLLTFILYNSYSQSNKEKDSLFKPNRYYLEDQLYFGISYIILKNLPKGISQNGFSNNIKLGYIRDIPINEKRNFGFGVGIGYSRDTYYHNLRIVVDEKNGNLYYDILENGKFKTNSLTLHKLDLPIEIRFRGSRYNKFKFWKLYTGVVLSYVLNSQSEFSSDNVDVTFKNIGIENPFKLGFSLSIGYGIWNFNFYYGFSNIIKNNIVFEDLNIKMQDMHFGIIYYFL